MKKRKIRGRMLLTLLLVNSWMGMAVADPAPGSTAAAATAGSDAVGVRVTRGTV